MRAEKFCADQLLLKLAHVAAAEDAVSRVQAKIDNRPAAPGVPLFTKPFDLSQLGHRADYVAREYDQRWIGRSASDAKSAASPPCLTSSKGLLDPSRHTFAHLRGMLD